MKLMATLILLSPVMALAAGGHDAHGAGHGMPTTVIYQAINLTILFGGIIYFAKDGIKQFFADRKAAYIDAAKKSASAREEAEKQFEEMKGKIAHLEATYASSIAQAKANAAELKEQMIADANAIAKRIKEEAELTVKLEIERAQVQLKQQLLKDSIETARMVLSKDVNANDHQTLQSQFTKNIEAVR